MALPSVLAMSCAEIFGNCHIKFYAETGKHKHLVLGLLGYAGLLYFLIKIFGSGSGNMLHVNTMWQSVVVVLGSVVAYFWLGDRMSHPIQYLGILLGILAVICVNYQG